MGDLERPNGCQNALFHTKRQLSRPTASNSLKPRPILSKMKMYPSLGFGIIWFMGNDARYLCDSWVSCILYAWSVIRLKFGFCLSEGERKGGKRREKKSGWKGRSGVDVDIPPVLTTDRRLCIIMACSHRRFGRDKTVLSWLQLCSHRQRGLFYSRLLARFTAHRLAKFGWVLFADLRLRSLAIKQNAEFTEGG